MEWKKTKIGGGVKKVPEIVWKRAIRYLRKELKRMAEERKRYNILVESQIGGKLWKDPK